MYFSASKVLIGSGSSIIKVDLNSMLWSTLLLDSNFVTKDVHFIDPANNDAQLIFAGNMNAANDGTYSYTFTT